MTGNAKFGSRLLKTNSISRHCKYFARVSPLKGFLLFGRGVPGVAWRGVALLAACCEDPHSHTITRHRRCHKLDAYLIWIGVSGWRLLAENQLSGNFYHLGVFPRLLQFQLQTPTPFDSRISCIASPFAYLLTNGSDTFTLFCRKIPEDWAWDWD